MTDENKYRLLAKKGEGSKAEVIEAQNIKAGTFHAIKCMKSSYTKDEMNNREEIKALKRLSPHPNIVKLDEVLFDSPSGKLELVFELQECNLYELMNETSLHFSDRIIKSFMRQIFTALEHLHNKGIFHWNIKVREQPNLIHLYFTPGGQPISQMSFTSLPSLSRNIYWSVKMENS